MVLRWCQASLVAQTVKNLPTMQELWVGKFSWRRKWQPTLVFLRGEFHGQRSLEGYRSQCHKKSDTTEQLTLTFKVMSWKLVTWAKFPGATSFMHSVSAMYHNVFFFFLTFILHWRVVGLQCVSFRYTKVIQLYTYI